METEGQSLLGQLFLLLIEGFIMCFAISKVRFAVVILCLSFCCVGSKTVQAADQSPEVRAELDAALAQARAELTAAKSELLFYLKVEHPRKTRRVAADIKLITLDIKGLKDRLRRYSSFHRSRYNRPFLVSEQNARLALLDAELTLKELQNERSTLFRFKSDFCKPYELKVSAARARVIALDRQRYGN